MNYKSFLVTSALFASLAGCNDKSPDYQQSAPPTTQASTPPPAELAEYKDDLNALDKTELCALDAVNGQAASEGSFKLAIGSSVVFEGWAATTSLTNPSEVNLVLASEGKAFVISGGAGVARDDVAKAYNAEALTNAGFKLELPALQVPEGEYTITVLHDEAGAAISCASPLKVIVE